MRIGTIRTAPPNSMVVIEDAAGRGQLPDLSISTLDARVIATESSIVVFCLMCQDGETTFTMGPADQVDPGAPPIFNAIMETPGQLVVVGTVEWQELLKSEVAGSHTRVKIWTNRVREPDEVIIGLEDNDVPESARHHNPE